MDERAHWLVDRIYAAALEPELWQEVSEGISALFGGSAVIMGFAIPGERKAGPRYAVGIEPAFVESYVEHLYRDLPWSTRYMFEFSDRWGHLGEVLDHVDLSASAFYTEWMKPQGLAAHWPVGHSIMNERGEVVAGFTVFRRDGEPPVDAAQYAEADVLVPHLRRAFEVQVALQGAQRVRFALAEAIDRLPTGLLLLDAERRVVVQNKGAERIIAAADGFLVDPNGPCAKDARENATLQRLIADALDARAREDITGPGLLAVSRPSGLRSYAVMVTPLLDAPSAYLGGNAVVAIFVADPSARMVSGPEVLEEMYQLTHSEAELVRLLSAGLSLDEAAEERGVSLNTARSHLKRAFAKTGTSRQGELVRLIISGVGQIREN